MSLRLSDLIKKTETKGISVDKLPVVKPWHSESMPLSYEASPETKSALQSAPQTTNTTLTLPSREVVTKTLKVEESLQKAVSVNASETIEALVLLIKQLRGIQFKIFSYVINSCTKNNSLESEKLYTPEIAEIIGCSHNSVKTSIQRLIDKGLLIRKKGKTSSGGFTLLSVTREVYMTARNIKSFYVSVEAPWVLQEWPGNYHHAPDTNQTAIDIKLPKEWQDIDIQPLAKIGLSLQHMVMLYQTEKVSPEIVQESINAYSWGIEHNSEAYKKYKNHLTVFLGVLKKGGSWVESAYESPQDIAFKNMIALRRQQKDKQDKMIDELVEVEFPQWRSLLDKTQINTIIPSGIGISSYSIEPLLKSHFKREVLIPRLKADGKLRTFADMDKEST